MSQLTKDIENFNEKLKTVDGRSPTDNTIAHLSSFLLQLSQRIDRIIDEDAEM
jgi:hypothetical protein